MAEGQPFLKFSFKADQIGPAEPAQSQCDSHSAIIRKGAFTCHQVKIKGYIWRSDKTLFTALDFDLMKFCVKNVAECVSNSSAKKKRDAQPVMNADLHDGESSGTKVVERRISRK